MSVRASRRRDFRRHASPSPEPSLRASPSPTHRLHPLQPHIGRRRGVSPSPAAEPSCSSSVGGDTPVGGPAHRVWRTPPYKSKAALEAMEAPPLAFRYPMLGSTMDMPGVLEQFRTTPTLLLYDWMREIEQQASVVGSDALLLHTKLAEALRLTEGTQQPSALRTAMFCHLLSCVVKSMSPLFAEAMRTIQRELLASIYHAPSGGR
jgi:hypothetical protein